MEASIDALLAEHVWEHLTPEEGILAGKVCFRYLKPGGYLRIAVPDGLFPDAEYIEFVKPGGVGPSAYTHKVLYTYITLQEVFRRAGFKVDLLEFFDEKGEFHYKQWDPDDGMIVRSMRFYDKRSFGTLKYRSLILDARK
jgi:predicted SAM-dependent methyltransferase